MNSPRLNSTWWILKIALGLAPLLAGLDKFFNVLTDWTVYLNPTVLEYVPVPTDVFLRCAGVVEILVGLLILTRWTRLGASLSAIWLTAIAVNLVSMGRFYDVAVRDVLLALASVALAQLTAARRSESVESVPARAQFSSGGLLHLNL